jgi:hypothetical protein
MAKLTAWPFSFLLGKVEAAIQRVRLRVGVTCYAQKARDTHVLKQTSPAISTLSGEEWLRLLTEMNLSACSGWCEPCRHVQFSGDTCFECQQLLTKPNAKLWERVGEKIRSTLASDCGLLTEIKAAWRKLHGEHRHLQFPAELQWLARTWNEAGRPPHRPFDPKTRYVVANWVQALQARGLSQEEIVSVMRGDFEEDTRLGPIKIGKQDYGKVPVQELRTLNQQFKKDVGYIPGSLLHREELWRTLEWVHRQRANPMARLRGERVRNRSEVYQSPRSQDSAGEVLEPE